MARTSCWHLTAWYQSASLLRSLLAAECGKSSSCAPAEQPDMVLYRTAVLHDAWATVQRNDQGSKNTFNIWYIPTFIASTNTWAVALSMRSDRVAGNFKPPREEWMNAKTPLMPLLSLALPYRWKTCKWFHCQQSQRISWLRFALRRALQSEFVRERNWDKHHTPRNLLLAMVGTFETQTVTRYDMHGLFSLSTRLGKLENYQRSCKK